MPPTGVPPAFLFEWAGTPSLPLFRFVTHKLDMALFAGCDANRLYHPALSHSELNAARVVRDARANPLLLMCRLCIEQALRDCLRTYEGEPTSDARDAYLWLSSDLDWTAKPGSAIPPAEIRSEIIFSFSWCASLLGINVEDIREHGLRRLSGFGHRSDVWLPGLQGIREHWAKAKREYEARLMQASHQHEASIVLERQCDGGA